VIKLIIYNFYLNDRFDIIASLIEFRPSFNTKYSYPNDLLYTHFGIDLGFWPHLIVYFISLVVVIHIHTSVKIKLNNRQSKVLDTAFLLYISAALCTLIGNLFWKEGILDYIYLKTLFIFDLKDVYASSFVLLYLLFAIKNRNKVENIDCSVRDIIMYIKNKVTNSMD
jgi:hypothetical protein